MNSLEKKSEDLSARVEARDETKNNTQLSEKSRKLEAENVLKDTASAVCGNESSDTKMTSSAGEDSIETKEMPAISPIHDDVKKNSEISKSLDENDKDGSCKSDDSTHSKDSEQLPDSDISVECETKKIDKGTCTTGETDCLEKDEPSFREYEVEEAPNDEEQTKGKEDNEEASTTGATSGDLVRKNDEDEKEIKSQTCEACHSKNVKEKPSSTREHASTSATCSSTKDSKILSTTIVNTTSNRSCCSCCGNTKDSNIWRILRCENIF